MSDQYYQFYVGDYQRDTCDLTLIEHGAYRVLLDYYYIHESLPIDRDRCLRIARAFTQAEQEAVDNVIFRFFKKVGDKLQNKRADIEIEKRKAFIFAQSERGHKGAEARWGKENKSQAMPQAMPQAMHKQWPDDGQPSPSPSPSPSQTKKNKTLVVYPNDFLSFWAEYPKSVKKKAAFKEWEKNKTKPGIEIILKAIREQKKNKTELKCAGQFCPEWPDPERWIKNERWNDELLEIKQGCNENKSDKTEVWEK